MTRLGRKVGVSRDTEIEDETDWRREATRAVMP